jgi:hypothetical protein
MLYFDFLLEATAAALLGKIKKDKVQLPEGYETNLWRYVFNVPMLIYCRVGRL